MATNEKIDGLKLYNAIIAGSIEVMANKKELNKINVFPVADGDTGSNLSATMKSVVEHMKKSDDLSIVANSAAEGALLGARGNSGIIFAQFLYGFHMEAKNQAALDPETFIQAMKTSSHRLYEVMLNPVEGTILTIIRRWVDSMEHYHREKRPLNDFINMTMKDSLTALEETTEQLAALKNKNVVDSGAKGFYHFLEGVRAYLLTGKIPVFEDKLMAIGPIEAIEEMNHFEHSTYRFCCEALISGDKMEVATVKKAMSLFGDSLVIAGGDERIRLHMHTNTPEEMFAKLQSFGTLSQIKADDMHLQMDAIQSPLYKTAIVTDSIADLPEGFAQKHQVFVIPLQLEVGEVVHLDRISLSVKRFYEMNRHLKEQPKSSLPPIKQVESLLHFLGEHYESVLVLCVSDQLSGTYQMVASVAQLQRKNGLKIAVVNTLKNSGAQGLLVMEACKMAAAGMGIDAMADQLYSLIPRTKILVAVDTVNYLERSGRVSRNAGKIARALHLKPIMTLDEQGKGRAYGGAISLKSVLGKIKKAVVKDHQQYGIECFNVVHAASPERAALLAREMEILLGKPAAYIGEISPIVGATAGEGAVAISYITRKR